MSDDFPNSAASVVCRLTSEIAYVRKRLCIRRFAASDKVVARKLEEIAALTEECLTFAIEYERDKMRVEVDKAQERLHKMIQRDKKKGK